MPQNRSPEPGKRDTKVKPRKAGSGEGGAGDPAASGPGPGGLSAPNSPGGTEQPKNDRRKRGDLQKRSQP